MSAFGSNRTSTVVLIHSKSREGVMKRIIAVSLSAVSLLFVSGVAWTAGQYGPGASDTEIKIGNTMPYSGPASLSGGWTHYDALSGTLG